MRIFPQTICEKLFRPSPQEILAGLAKLQAEIKQGMKELEGMLR